MLDQLFTKHNDDIKDIKYWPLLEKNDHVVIKLKYCLLQKKIIVSNGKKKYNNKRGDYRNPKDFFDSRNWETLLVDENLDVPYSNFVVYRKGVENIYQNSKLKQEMTINASVINARKWEKTSSSFGKDSEDIDFRQHMKDTKQKAMNIPKPWGRKIRLFVNYTNKS